MKQPARGRAVAIAPAASHDVDAIVRAENEQLRALAQQAVTDNTRQAYASDWKLFEQWCAERNVPALPATSDTLMRYVLALVNRKEAIVEDRCRRSDGSEFVRRRRIHSVKSSTVARHLVSIRKRHVIAGYPDPTVDHMLQSVVKGLRRTRGTEPEKKAELRREDLIAVLAAPPKTIPAGLSERHAERRTRAAILAETRDRALLLIGWSGAFRRAEIAAIDREHIVFDPEGVDITLPSAKTSKDGKYQHVLIAYGQLRPELCPIRALTTWLTLANIESGPVFRRLDRHGNILGRINPKVVARVIKAGAAAAKLDAKLDAKLTQTLRKKDKSLYYAGHSLRSGWISTAVEEGREERVMMKHTRHQNVAVFRGYVQEATKWQNHPGAGLL